MAGYYDMFFFIWKTNKISPSSANPTQRKNQQVYFQVVIDVCQVGANNFTFVSIDKIKR